MRTVFVEVPGEIADIALAEVTRGAQRATRGPYAARDSRVRRPSACATRRPTPGSAELLNIFVQEGEQLFDAALPMPEGNVMLGAASACSPSSRSSSARTTCAVCSR